MYQCIIYVNITEYVDKLMTLLFDAVLKNPEHYQQLHSDIIVPPSLCSKFVRPTESDIAFSSSRFNRKL